MVQLLWALSFAVVVSGAWYAFSRTRDPFHPAIILAPSFAFIYGIWPFLLNNDLSLSELLGQDNLLYVGFYYFCALGALYLGLSRLPHPRLMWQLRHVMGLGKNIFTLNVSNAARRRLFRVAIFLGLVALAAYINMLGNAGGLIAAYSRAKGGGFSGSGYVGEAILLSFPAILLLGIARQGTRRIRAIDVLISLLIALPHLLQGTLGGRRGPLFLVLAVLFLAWFLARGKAPPLRSSLLGFGLIGFLVLLVASQREELFLGSGGEFSPSRLMDIFLTPSELETNDYVAGAASIIVDNHTQAFTWGREHLINLFVRPIPRQLWRTKYEDASALFGITVVEGGGDWDQFADVLGFSPPKGSAVGFIADLYGNFSWGALLVVFIVGWSLATLWKRHRLQGGFWTVLFAEAMILSVYLPTQSFSAFYHRFLIMALITLLVFKFYVKPGATSGVARPRV